MSRRTDKQHRMFETYEGRRGNFQGWKVLTENATRCNQVYPDATQICTFSFNPEFRGDLNIWIEESFEMSNGVTRTNQMSVSLSNENVEILKSLLAQIDTSKENPEV